MTVPELLAMSRAFHLQSTPRAGRARDLTALKQAADLRLEALGLDPAMSDPAWKAGPSHESLMLFYREQLGDLNG